MQIVLLETFKIDLTPIITFDISNISFINLNHQICVLSSAQPVIVNVSLIAKKILYTNFGTSFSDTDASLTMITSIFQSLKGWGILI